MGGSTVKIVEKVKSIEPVDNWRYWYRKWSFWIISLIPVITAAQLFIPDVQDLFEPQTYMLLKSGLAVLAFVASQIKQQAIAVPPNPPAPEDQP